MGKGKRETVFSLAKGKFTAKHITTPVIQNIFTAQMAIWGNRGDLKRKFYKNGSSWDVQTFLFIFKFSGSRRHRAGPIVILTKETMNE